MDDDPYVLCGDCQHCSPTLYEADGECGPECHPGIACIEKPLVRDLEVGA